jgi:trk system potassium uptake protein TrkH
MPAIVVLLIFVGMITGGMIGSTCGGLKTNRFRLMLRSIPWMIRKACSPAGAIIPLKHDNVPVEDEYMMITQAFIACYMVILFLGTAIVLMTGVGFLDSAFQTVSALGGVGLSTASPALFHPLAKSVLIVAMLFGRLEIIPLLVLGKFFYDRARSKLRKREEDARKLFYTKWIPSDIWKKRP